MFKPLFLAVTLAATFSATCLALDNAGIDFGVRISMEETATRQIVKHPKWFITRQGNSTYIGLEKDKPMLEFNGLDITIIGEPDDQHIDMLIVFLKERGLVVFAPFGTAEFDTKVADKVIEQHIAVTQYENYFYGQR